jgi:hypothetical protein
LKCRDIFSFPSAPFSNWQFQLAAKTDGPVALTENPGTIHPDISISGPGAAPILEGTVALSKIKAHCDGRGKAKPSALPLNFLWIECPGYPRRC